jgi:hypothetical protein
MYTPNGMLYGNWRLPMAGADIDLTANGGAAIAGANQILSPLQKNASKLLILDRLSNIGARGQYQDGSAGAVAAAKAVGASYDGLNHPGGHQKGLGNLLTGEILVGGASPPSIGNAGLGNGISLDQVLAKNFGPTGRFKTKFASLEIGVQTNEDLTDRYVDKRISYDGPGKPRAPVTNPFVLFRNVFGTGMPGSVVNNMRSDMDKSVLDNAVNDFTRLQPKLSKGDQVLLQQHSDSIRKIETQLTAVFNVDCKTIMPLTAPAGVDPTDDNATHKWAMLLANYPMVGALNMNIMVQAMACGLTNIATFFWANSETNMTFPWLSVSKGHHGMSHARDPQLVKVDQWYATQFGAMIDALSAIPESGGTGTTMLDNSLLWWVNCLSDGSSHHSDNMPFTLAGSNGGYFKQGHAIRYNDVYTTDPINDQKAPPAGKPDLSNNDLMTSILNSFEVAMDPTLPPSTSFGRKDFCRGPLPNVKA